MRSLILILLLALPSAAHADPESCPYRANAHPVFNPADHTIELTLCQEHFGFGALPALSAISAAVNEINSVPNSDVRMTITGFAPHADSYDDARAADGINFVDVFPNDDACGPSGTCGANGRCSNSPQRRCSWNGQNTVRLNSDRDIVGFDVVFDQGLYDQGNFWDPSTWPDPSAPPSGFFRSVALHELLHALLSQHPGRLVPSALGERGGGPSAEGTFTLHPRDEAHIRYHYPEDLPNWRVLNSADRADWQAMQFVGPDGHDLSASNYEMRNVPTASGGTIRRLRLTVQPPPTAPFNRPRVCPGDAVDVAWTAQNFGRYVTGGFDTDVVFSDGPLLGSDDTVRSPWFVPAQMSNGSSIRAESATVAIPDGTAPGLYGFLIVVDADDEVAEFDEDNNVLPVWQVLRVLNCP